MPTQTFRTSKSFSTSFTHIARLGFKGHGDKQADGHVLSSDTVRQQPPISDYGRVSMPPYELQLSCGDLIYGSMIFTVGKYEV